MKQDPLAGQTLRESESHATGYGSGRARILVTAERLFGEKGIDGVSMREVAVAAGQANNSAVALHFGTKAGLIAAIIETRRPVIDTIRRKRVADMYARDPEPSLRDLIESLMMPWVDDVDDRGNHPYACFVAQLMWAERGFYPFDNLGQSAPISLELLQTIKAYISHIDDVEMSFRMRLMVQMFLTTVLHKGHMGFAVEDEVTGQPLFDKLIDLTTTVLSAPV